MTVQFSNAMIYGNKLNKISISKTFNSIHFTAA